MVICARARRVFDICIRHGRNEGKVMALALTHLVLAREGSLLQHKVKYEITSYMRAVYNTKRKLPHTRGPSVPRSARFAQSR